MENRFKYKKTLHAPFSEQLSKGDKRLKDYSDFEGKEVVVSIKMDGENTSLYTDYYHARSLDGNSHPSRDWVKGLWGNIGYQIPEGWRVCGENMYAQHSIIYDDLDSYFYVFNIWDEVNMCLPYDDTIEWCNLLGIEHVPVLWRGKFDVKTIETLFNELDKTKHEGIVVRNAYDFHYGNFQKNIFKAVRAGHVQTEEHWMHSQIIPNKLKEK